MTAVAGTLGLLLVATAGGLWFRALRTVRVPKNRTGFVATWIAGAGLGMAALTEDPGWMAGVPAVLAVVGGSFFCLTAAISRQKLGASAICVGAELPDFSALDENRETFESSQLAGNPALVKFFRGHW